nr:dATP/dGTP pyrophosphohydrolase domain-containing protein [Salmonella enterica]
MPVYAAPPASERERIRREHAEWSDATFGNVGPVGPLKHLSKEALEAAAEPGDLSEWADMQFLLWDAQRRAGISDEQITQAMTEKLAINKARQWPDPKDGEPRLHIKEQSAPVVPEEMPKGLAGQIVSLLAHNIGDKFLAQKIWNACRAALLQGSQPVSNHDELPYAQVKAVADLYAPCWQSGEVVTYTPDPEKATIWLNNYSGTCVQEYVKLERLQEALAGNSPVTPDGWISCSERMPEQGAYISAVSKHGEYVAGQVIDDWLDLHDGTSFGLDEVYLWMMLPPLPASPQQ